VGDLKTTQEERAEWHAILDAESADMGAAEVVTSLLVLSDLDTLLAENAKLRAEVAYLADGRPLDAIRRTAAEMVKLRAVAEAARARCRDAVPEWAPELRAALAALEAP
jgi:cell division protein FtsB